MDDELAERFLEDGFVKIEGAFPPRVAEGCARLLWQETGCDPEDPATWNAPVHWVSGMAQGPFAAAANSPALHEAFDLLVGERRWAPRYSLGSFPLRFPHEEERATWTRINDDAHQWGWTGAAITGDPRVQGRVYVSTNGRGVIYGDTSTPAAAVVLAVRIRRRRPAAPAR